MISEGDKVLIKMPSNNCKIVSLKSSDQKVNLGKFGSFNAGALIGKPFGCAWDILPTGLLAEVDPSAATAVLEDLVADEDEEHDDDDSPARNNANLVDREENQKVSMDEINLLKKEMGEGKIDPSDIIKTLVTNNTSHDSKTRFAQLKFIRRKARKYSKRFFALEPSARNLCEYYFATKPQKTRGLRIDTLAQIMCFSNAMASSNILVCDSVGGLLLGSLLERMTFGEQDLGGRLFWMMDGDTPNFDIVKEMNISDKVVERTLDYLAWSRLEPADTEDEPVPVPESTDPQILLRHSKKVAAIAKTRASRAKLAPNAFDGLVIATQFEVLEVLDKLLPYVGHGRPVVAYSQHKESLVPAYLRMRASAEFVNAQVTETMTREYQVPLSGLGTHPFMATSGSGGYILSATRVCGGGDEVAGASNRTKNKEGGAGGEKGKGRAQTSKKRRL